MVLLKLRECQRQSEWPALSQHVHHRVHVLLVSSALTGLDHLAPLFTELWGDGFTCIGMEVIFANDARAGKDARDAGRRCCDWPAWS